MQRMMLRVVPYVKHSVCKQWQRVARCWWKSVKVLNFEGVFVSFQGLHAGIQ